MRCDRRLLPGLPSRIYGTSGRYTNTETNHATLTKLHVWQMQLHHGSAYRFIYIYIYRTNRTNRKNEESKNRKIESSKKRTIGKSKQRKIEQSFPSFAIPCDCGLDATMFANTFDRALSIYRTTHPIISLSNHLSN